MGKKVISDQRKTNIPVKEAKKDTSEKVFIYKPGLKVPDVAAKTGVTSAIVIKKIMQLGALASITSELDRDMIELIVADFGYKVVDELITDAARFDEITIVDLDKDLVKRPPIVTIMGHVDHGKTTLLDTIRQSRVALGEAGGITQHIGAYEVERNKQSITFIDTPGHAAFTKMRERGANLTDITVLVVAADDGVMPQTLEAIDHAKAAKVPIIVAVNKIDKMSANPDRVMTELAERGLVPEAWGGKTPFVKISALKNIGIEELLDVIQLFSEISEFKANPNRLARGVIVEASLDKGRGPVATVIVQNGTLKSGDYIVAGTIYGKIRTMQDDFKKRFNEAAPSKAVEITGLSDVPFAGDIFMAFKDEKEARDIASERSLRKKELDFRQSKKATLDVLLGDLENAQKELNLLIKGDVQGSIEALRKLLEDINIDGFHANVIRSSVGAITENDITLAATSGAIVIGFNVRPTQAVRQLAESKGIEIRLYNIIYRVQEDIEAALKGMLAPKLEEVVIGQAEVREIFKASKIGTIAGSYVTDGVIKRDSLVRLIRDGIVFYEGKIASLKRFKDDAKEVKQGYECGISIENYTDLKVGDIIEASQMKVKESEGE